MSHEQLKTHIAAALAAMQIHHGDGRALALHEAHGLPEGETWQWTDGAGVTHYVVSDGKVHAARQEAAKRAAELHSPEAHAARLELAERR